MNRQNRIQSKVQAIAQLAFYPLPTRPIAVARAMRSGDHYVVIGADGRIYTSQARTHLYWTTTGRMDSTVRALIRMGMLSADAVQQHNAAAEQESARRKRRWAADSILGNMEAAGLKLTAVQRRKLEEAAADNEQEAP